MSSENWSKVDNVAKVFLATHTKRDSRSLRISMTLSEKVDPALLQEALLSAIKSRPQFQVRIRRGFFWHYLEATDALPKVTLEKDRPCPTLYGNAYDKTLHYSVTYYQNRINLDIFHALSDGTGALLFLRSIVLRYLKLKYPSKMQSVSPWPSGSATDLSQNSFKQFYDKGKNLNFAKKNAYHIHGAKLSQNQLQFFEVQMPAGEVLKRAKECKVTLTSYIGALLMLSIYKDMPLLKRKKPVSISIPVNLRNFYPSETLRNFFNNINVAHIFHGEETLSDLARDFDDQLKANLTKEKIHQQMNNFQRLENLFFIRMVPLLFKQPVVKFFSKRNDKQVSCILSNMGVLKLPEEMKQFVTGYSAHCSHTELFLTICCYEDTMSFGITSAYRNTNVIKNFVRSFSKEGIPVKLYATEVL